MVRCAGGRNRGGKLNNINKYFNGLKESIYDNIVGNVIGTVERVSGLTADVQPNNDLPLLINLPRLDSVDILEKGDEVLVVFLNNDLSTGAIVGKLYKGGIDNV